MLRKVTPLWFVFLFVLLLSACAAPQPVATQVATEAAGQTPSTEIPTEAPVEVVTQESASPTPATAETVEAAPQTRKVIDSRGVEVEIPTDPKTVVSVSDALVEEVMTILGVQDRLIGIGSTCLVRDFTYDFETTSGEKFSYSGGMNPANYLNPNMIDLPMFVKPGTEMNFESLASLNADVLIVDVGACTLSWGDDPDAMRQGLERLDSLGIPTIVLMGPNSGGNLDINALSGVIKILGEVFNQPEKAEKLASYLEESIQLVIDRTKDIPDEEKPDVLLLGLNPDVRQDGGVGNASGLKDIQSYFVEEIVHARNAFREDSSATLNPEQILALDPDVIILPTSNGYHPPRELYETSHFQKIQTLQAIQNQRIGALPWSPCNCDKRLEYPIDVYVIAKMAYPDLFADIDLSEWALQFYKDVYGVDDDGAMGLLQAQWMEWTLEED